MLLGWCIMNECKIKWRKFNYKSFFSSAPKFLRKKEKTNIYPEIFLINLEIIYSKKNLRRRTFTKYRAAFKNYFPELGMGWIFRVATPVKGTMRSMSTFPTGGVCLINPNSGILEDGRVFISCPCVVKMTLPPKK